MGRSGIIRVVRRYAALLIALLLAPAAARADDARITSERTLAPQVLELTIATSSFSAPTSVRVHLPAGYDADPRRRWPVLYYLAGFTHDETSFDSEYGGTGLVRSFPALVVTPSGRSGWWSDWYNGGAFGAPRYETFVTAELPRLIDTRFRTIAARRGRALMGESMGGYGAMSLAALHPDRYVAAVSLSGALDNGYQPITALVSSGSALMGAPPDAIYGPRSEQPLRWEGHNPPDLAANLRDVDLQVRTAAGTIDLTDPDVLGSEGYLGACVLERQVHTATQTFVTALRAEDVPHVFKDYGSRCHTPRTFHTEIADSLPGLEQVFANPPPAPRRFRYRTIAPGFDVYGWHVARTGAGFLSFGAGRHAVTLSGTGPVTVTTPRWFRGARSVRLRGLWRTVRPKAGRVTFAVDLGDGSARTVRF